MRPRLLVLALAAIAGCADPSGPPGGTDPNPDPGKKYEANATVLESPAHGPELCLGAVLESYPPQCGGVPIAGWDWTKVEGEEKASGTTWGIYHVVGTFDGTTFKLTDPPGSPQPQTGSTQIAAACPEPSGGWPRPQPALTGDADFEAARAAASAQPDFAGLWIFDPNPPSGEQAQDISKIVLNVAFTGDLERHETELRKHWGGALCVAKHAHTLAKLEQIKNELGGDAGELGLRVLTADANEVKGIVELSVVFFEAEDQAALDARYGKGVVVLTAALKPVS